jgi:hypothetical protein
MALSIQYAGHERRYPAGARRYLRASKEVNRTVQRQPKLTEAKAPVRNGCERALPKIRELSKVGQADTHTLDVS